MKIAIKNKEEKHTTKTFDVEKFSGNFCYKLLLDIYYKTEPLTKMENFPFYSTNIKEQFLHE